MGAHLGPNIVEDGLVIYLDAANPNSYPGSGNTWYDLSGNDMVLSAGIVFSNKSFVCDGNDYARYDSNIVSIEDSEYTMDALFYISSSSGTNQYIFSNGAQTASEGGTIMYTHSSDSFEWTVQIASTSARLLYPSNGFEKWYHICGTVSSGVSKMYINGSFFDQSSVSTTSLDPQVIGVTVGTPDNSLGNYGLNGRISSIKAYERALSEIEVQQNFQATRSRFGL